MPGFNAVMNSLSALFLAFGFYFIKKKDIPRHRFCMLSATACSAIFLVSYLYYHWHHGSTRFTGQGWIRPVYFAILISHTILAAVQVPLIITTLVMAFKGKVEAHKRFARITWPIWMYVSVTGVIIYVMLYKVFSPTLF